jgi:hypothetical protein
VCEPLQELNKAIDRADGLLLGLDGLLLQQSGEEYNVVLDATVQSIYDASNT